jgi:hypothetical protein
VATVIFLPSLRHFWAQNNQENAMLIKDFEKKWMAFFANGIDQKAIQKYVVSTGNYIWHIFSWELLPKESYLTGDAARKAYNNLSKQQRECALYIEPFGDEKTFCMSAQDPTAEKLDDYTEIYVAAADFSWTYIKTHEGDWCGPYFYRKEK